MIVDDLIAELDPKHGVVIAGQGVGTASTFPVDDPATSAVIAEVSDGGLHEATAAEDAASEAFRDWAATPSRLRADILRRAYELMLEDSDRLSALICAENGKSRADARAEVTYAAEFFRWYAEEAVRTDGSYGASPSGGARTIVTHRPVGVAALVTPWNFPAAMATRTVPPALAAGCTVVLKPAADAPEKRAGDRCASRPRGNSARRRQRRPDLRRGRRRLDMVVGQADPQDLLHRLHPCRAPSADAVSGPGCEHQHGTRRQRAVRGHRRRRRGRRGRGRDDRQVPRKRPGLYRGESLLRSCRRRRRIHQAVRSSRYGAEGRAGL